MSTINDVSDTALWVAVYRAEETQRADALFRDPLAEKLLGDRARKIEASMSATEYTRWHVVIRTVLIDQMIRELVGKGIERVVNLGAGLDTRPYRMDLPASLQWIEVDFPHMVELKNEKLKGEAPKVKLDRIGADLANDDVRRALLQGLGADSRPTLVLTEGVVPYLTEAQVKSLAQDLQSQKSFRYWILERLDSSAKKYLRSKKRLEQMKNAPFQFFPEDWEGLFQAQGWKPTEYRSIADAAKEAGRKFPAPWWMKPLFLLNGKRAKEKLRTTMAYVVLENQNGAR